MRKRPSSTVRRSGQIIEKRPGKYLIRVFLGRDAGGKRQYRSKLVEGTISEARKALTALQKSADQKLVVKRSRESLQQYLEEWLDQKRGITEQTRANYQTTLSAYIYSLPVARRRLDTITREDVQAIYRHWEDAGRSSRTIQYIHMILNQALEHAVATGKLPKNPCKYTERPTVERTQEIKVFTKAEIQQFLQANVGEKNYPLFHFLLHTGMRPQEALALRWSDLDLERRQAHIRQVIAVLRGGKQVIQAGRAKTKRSLRPVVLPEATIPVLKAHRKAVLELRLKRGEAWQDLDLVFPSSEGTPQQMTVVRRHWRWALERAKLPHRRLYDSRHTYITHLVANGASAAVVAAQVGNSPKLTLDVYTHVLEEQQAQLGDLVARVLGADEAPAQAVGQTD